MDESGDEFAWEEIPDRRISTSSSDMDDSDADKNYKKKLHQELFKKPKLDDDKNEKRAKKHKKSKHKELLNESHDSDSFELKTVKTEPESDIDSIKTKKVKTKNYLQKDTTESMEVDDASYLDLLVKEEGIEHKKQKKKKKKKSECSLDELPLNDSCVDESVETDVKSELELSKKKKKKKDKKERESVMDTKDLIAKELFSEEETIVGPPTIQASSTKIKKKKNKDKSPSPFNESSHSDINDIEKDTGSVVNHNGTLVSPLQSDNYSEKNHIERNSTVLSRKERNARISDRILFEEEDDSQQGANKMELDESAQKSCNLQQYLKSRRNLKMITYNALREYSITPDDEVWLLKCPSDFKVSSLKDVNLPLNSKFKIKMDSHTYEGNMDDEVSKCPILTYTKSKATLKNLPLSGTMVLRKRIPKAHFVADKSISNIQTDFIPLPDTKCRHPLFGPNYKKAIKLSVDVQARLSPHCRELTPPSEKKKKKKHRPKLECKSEEATNGIKEVTETREERRARKRSRRESEQQPAAKRARHAPAWDCEQDIQDHLFNY